MEEEFKRVVSALIPKNCKVSIGTVSSIEGVSCTVAREELPKLLDVRLHSIIDSLENYILIVPKIGSHVVVAEIDNAVGETVIIQYSEIESLDIKIDGFEFGINQGRIKVKNQKTDLKNMLTSLFNGLSNAIITTPSGAGKFSPTDKTNFENLKKDTLNLFQ